MRTSWHSRTSAAAGQAAPNQHHGVLAHCQALCSTHGMRPHGSEHVTFLSDNGTIKRNYNHYSHISQLPHTVIVAAAGAGAPKQDSPDKPRGTASTGRGEEETRSQTNADMEGQGPTGLGVGNGSSQPPAGGGGPGPPAGGAGGPGPPAGGAGGSGASSGDDAPSGNGDRWRSYPTWLKYWLWATALVYLVARTRWRAERDEKRKVLEREVEQEEEKQAEWNRFVTDYASRQPGTRPSKVQQSK